MNKIEGGQTDNKWTERKRIAAHAIQGTVVAGYYLQLGIDTISRKGPIDLSWIPTTFEPLQHISNSTLSYFAVTAAVLVGENIRYSVGDRWKGKVRNISLIGGGIAAASVNAYVESGIEKHGVADSGDLAYGLAAIPLSIFAVRELYIKRNNSKHNP
jgi:hypothetical protein